MNDQFQKYSQNLAETTSTFTRGGVQEIEQNAVREIERIKRLKELKRLNTSKTN